MNMILVGEEDPLGRRCRGFCECTFRYKVKKSRVNNLQERRPTDEVFSFPIVGATIDRDIKAHVALVLQERLHANRAISVYHRAHHYLVLETTFDFLRLVEAWPRDIDYGAAKHVSTLRSKNQWQMSAGCGRQNYRASKSLL